ncbi:MAG TPA: hypothetical protein VEB60_00535 [Candidatus Paceibacterota bacterium]|nr:hypothetical protein [Candidatus Paceibacterota bacterium]
MARCEQCLQQFHQADACTWQHVEIEGQVYGREGTYAFGKRFEQAVNADKDRCDDCGVLAGSVHHFGCTLERCPRCGEALATCACDEVYPRYEEKKQA